MLLQDWIEQVHTSFPDPQSARYEARLLAQQITQLTPTQLRLNHYELNEAERQALDKLAVRREQGTPIAYLIGWQPFYGLKLFVTPDTLIPRGDTEFVVDMVLAQIKHQQKPIIADLGTGSGAIALALANERKDARLIAIDNSLAALEIAQRNAEFNQINNVSFICANWLDALNDASIDYIITNPPYIAENDPHLSNLQFEPQSALVAQDNGMADIHHILERAPRVLKPKGQLFIEHGYNQAEALHKFALNLERWSNVITYNDYGQQPRLTTMTLKNAIPDSFSGF